MKSRPLLMSLVLGVLFSSAVAGQSSHVHIEYDEKLGTSFVTADDLYVVNMSKQFMSVRLTANYLKKGPPTQAPHVGIVFTSFAPQNLYESEQTHQLRAKIDDRIADFGALSYGKSAGVNGKNPDMRGALPAVALLRSNGNVEGLALEIMRVSAQFADVSMMAEAKSVIMKIGDTVFPLTATQMSILREFVAAITPAKIDSTTVRNPAAPAEPLVAADVPSDQNQASLEQTLKWIETEIEHEGGEDLFTPPRKIEPLDLKSCAARYRLVPGRRTSTVSDQIVYAILEYRLNLGELNAEGLKVNALGNRATVFVPARDQSKIKVISHRNESGTMGATAGEAEVTFVVIFLKSIESASRMKVALTHAINLCRSQH